MERFITTLTAQLRTLASPQLRDRGEVGPIGYSIMVAGIVLLAVAVVAWGESIANTFMNDVPYGDGGGDE